MILTYKFIWILIKKLFNIVKFRILTSDSFFMLVIIVTALGFRDAVRLG